MLVQFTITEKDKILNDLLQKLEEEGGGKRGYIPEQLRERLKIFELLSQKYEIEDPYELFFYMVENINKPIESPKQEEPEEVEESTRDVGDMTSGLLGGFKNKFNLDKED